MANIIIPDLPAATALAGGNAMSLDDGIQTYKISGINLAKAMKAIEPDDAVLSDQIDDGWSGGSPWAAMNDLSCTIVTRGRPVFLTLVPIKSVPSNTPSGDNLYAWLGQAVGPSGAAMRFIKVGSPDVVVGQHKWYAPVGKFLHTGNVSCFVPVLAAGTHTFKMQAHSLGTSETIVALNLKLLAFEVC